jgi:uncharacterized membrane protein HdeD (DUF308 family)
MTRYYVGSSRGLVLRGIVALLFGLGTLVWPDVTLWTLVLMWGAFALVDGAVALTSAITDKHLLHRGWTGFWGITGIVAGAVTLLWPSITAVALLVVIAVWALFSGTSMMAMAFAEHKRITGEWLIGLTGLLTVLLGVLLLVNPAGGALAVTWAIGWFACLYGILSFALAWDVRREAKNPVRHADLGVTRSEQPIH